MSSCEQRCQYCKLWKVGWKKIEALQLSMLWHKPSKCIVPCSQITVKIATHVLKRIGRCFLPPPVASLAVPILSLGIEHWALTCYLFHWYWCHSWHPVIKLTLLSECSTASRPASQLLSHSHPACFFPRHTKVLETDSTHNSQLGTQRRRPSSDWTRRNVVKLQ